MNSIIGSCKIFSKPKNQMGLIGMMLSNSKKQVNQSMPADSAAVVNSVADASSHQNMRGSSRLLGAVLKKKLISFDS